MTTKTTTLKTAIAVPADLLAAVDRTARERGESRSRFIQHVLREAVRARRDAEITRRLDALFQDEAIRSAQGAGARRLDEAGPDWKEKGW